MQDFLATYGIWIVAMILAGVIGGFAAGLLGVGGGIVIVPVLYFVLGGVGVADSVRMKVAVATSLATIIFTSLSSARSHYKRGAVDFALLKSWGVPIFIGVVVGTVIAGRVAGLVLTMVFAVVALLVAVNMIARANHSALVDDFPNIAVKSVAGFFVGLISAMMGIGGGTLSVPILTAFGFDIRKAVGTAAAIGFIIAIPGTVGYVLAGWGNADLPAGSLGYANVIALVALVPLTMLIAPLGARVAHVIPRKVLSYAFAAFLGVTALRMFIDVFQKLGM